MNRKQFKFRKALNNALTSQDLIPKPIVLTALPTEDMTTQAELDAIGLTADEMAAATQGLRTGVVYGSAFYGIDLASANADGSGSLIFARKVYANTTGLSVVNGYEIGWTTQRVFSVTEIDY